MSRYSKVTSKRLRELLTLRNMSAQELANRSGVSKGSISQYLNGIYTPTEPNAIKIAEALGVSADYIMGVEPSNNNSTDIDFVYDGDNPMMIELFSTATQLDDYFLKRLLAYANKLHDVQNDL